MAFEDIQAVSRQTLPDQVFVKLRDALMCGRFEPGQRIPLRTIAAAVGTSTMPAREAVNRLIAMGALELLPNRRVSVPLLTAGRYQDLASARMIVEGAAAEAATPNLTDDLVDELSHIHRKMQFALKTVDKPGGHAAYLDANKQFHFLIYAASQSDCLTSIIETLWLKVGPYLNLNLVKSRDWFTSDQHAPILSAIASRNPQAVAAAVRANIGFAAEFVIARNRLDAINAGAEA